MNFLSRLIVFFVCGPLIPFTTAMATTYVVDNGSPQCSDIGDGTSQQPFCTISAAATKALSGDSVTVKSGTYQEHVVFQQSGESGSPITFIAASGETVIISGQTNGLEFPGVNWVTIDGFNVDNTSSSAILLDAASNINIRNNLVSNADKHGIEIKGCTNINIDNNDVSDSLGYGIYSRDSSDITVNNNHVSGSGLPFQGLTRKGIYFNNTIDSFISGNTSESNTNSGIYLSNSSTNNQIIGNHTYANARVYVRAAPGIELRNSTGNTIEANISHNNEDTGIQIYPGAADNLIINNLTYTNGDHGIDVLDAPNNRILSNTVYNNVTSGINVEGSSINTAIANNLSVDNAIDSPRTRGNIRVDSEASPGTIMDYDLVYLTQPGTNITWKGTGYSTLAEFQASTSMEMMGIEANPDWIAPESADFHLNTSSPAIDSADSSIAGMLDRDLEMLPRVDDPTTTNTGNGPPSSFYDRGAFEFQAGNNTPPSVAITEPSDGATVSGQITIYADASDLDGTVTGVQFSVDGNNISIEDTSSPYSVSWDSNTISDGDHILTALASDDEGASTTSSPINVTVANNVIELSVIASNDAYIKQSSPNSNKGSSKKLWTDSSPRVYEFLLKFNVTGIGSKQVLDSKLALQTSNSSVEAGEVHLITDNNWSEDTVTWNNAPATDPNALGTLGQVNSGTTAVFDLSQIITGDGTYSIRIKALSADAAGFYSKESTGLEPKLLITAQ